MPSPECIEAMFLLEGFWKGAIAARSEIYTDTEIIPTMKQAFFHHNAIDNLEFLALTAHCRYDVLNTHEFHRWLNWPSMITAIATGR